MASSSSSLLQLQDNSAFLLDCENLLDQSHTASDPGYYSACSSLSPASSTDSCCFSPPSIQHGSWPENIPGNFLEKLPESFQFQSTRDQEDKKKSSKPGRKSGRSRSKFPGVKRQTASEREKLRMRDLTKALQHLRGYLPSSVAPVGQTLTKIETLRLTINYIAHLSTKLETGNNQPEVEALGSLPGFSGQMEASTPPVPTVYQPEIFSQASPPSQSFHTQEFLNMTAYQNQECSLPPSPAQDYWFPQQQYSCYYGQC